MYRVACENEAGFSEYTELSEAITVPEEVLLEIVRTVIIKKFWYEGLDPE